MSLFIALSLAASHLTVQDPCSHAAWLNVPAVAQVGDTVGKVTIATLSAHGVPFVGDEQGITSIRGTIAGDAALEILSGHELRAYGWCYRLNGIQPDGLTDEVKMEHDSDVIEWFFGYAHYLDGAWVSMCTPTSEERPGRVCPDGR